MSGSNAALLLAWMTPLMGMEGGQAFAEGGPQLGQPGAVVGPRVANGRVESRLQRVEKPVVSDWPAPSVAVSPTQPQSRTAFQNPQQFNVPGFQEGFAQGANQQQGPLRAFAGNLGEATRQSVNDLGQGVRGVSDGAAQGVESTVDALGNVGRNTANAGNPAYFDGRRQAAQSRDGQSTLGQSGTVPPPAWSGGQPNSAFAPQAAGRQPEPDLFDNDLPRSPAQQQFDRDVRPANGQIATSFADEQDQFAAQQQEWARRDRQSQLAPVGQTQGQSQPPAPYPNQSQQGFSSQQQPQPQGQGYGGQQGYSQAPPAGGYQAQGAARPPFTATSQQTPPPLLTAPQLNTTQTQQGPGFGAPTQQPGAGYQPPLGYGQPPATTASNWPDPRLQQQQGAVRPTQFQQPPAPQQAAPMQTAGIGGAQAWAGLNDLGTPPAGVNSTQQPSSTTLQQSANAANNSWLYAVWMLASWAITVYVGMTYLDTRNKYRSVLRRGPVSYGPAV